MVVPGFAGFRGWAGRAAVAVIVVDDVGRDRSGGLN